MNFTLQNAWRSTTVNVFYFYFCFLQVAQQYWKIRVHTQSAYINTYILLLSLSLPFFHSLKFPLKFQFIAVRFSDLWRIVKLMQLAMISLGGYLICLCWASWEIICFSYIICFYMLMFVLVFFCFFFKDNILFWTTFCL